MKTGIFWFCLFLCNFAQAQLSVEQKETAINDVIEVLNEKYVHRETAQNIEKEILNNYHKGSYDSLKTGEDFAFILSEDLKKISKDLHLGVEYAPVNDVEVANTKADDKNQHEEWLNTILTSSNYGINKKEILPGNIGYLNIPLFGPLDRVADTLIAAMDFVKDTDALILDVRDCRGSLDPHTIPFLSGYFFEEPVHLINIYTRHEDKTQQLWSAAWVPGKKYADKPIYILTSGRTFSGGEAFAFQLQQQKRATLIGNTTRGGGNPTVWTRINNLFAVTVPFATSTDPLDNSSWEGIGVIPDVPVKTQLALHEAHLIALRDLEKEAGLQKKEELSGVIKNVEQNKPIFKIVRFELEGYEAANQIAIAGTFNSWERDVLFMERKGSRWIAEAEMVPGKHMYKFIVDGKWINDPSNPDTEILGEHENSVIWVD